MKATELRIGNYINRINRNHEVHLPDGITYVVQEIGFDCIIYPLGKNPAQLAQMPVVYQKDLSPIPLTEEWLLKFGFNKMRESEYTMHTYEKKGLRLWNRELDFSKLIFECMDLQVKYVHQLQNLYFALTGEELKISAQ